VDKAISLWKAGQLVAIPTETVYGLAADATNGEAVARIYSVKSRPQFNPLIVHVADTETATRYVEWNDAAELLAKDYWPGPLTLVLKRKQILPSPAGGGSDPLSWVGGGGWKLGQGPFSTRNPRSLAHAEELRQNQTEAEKKLWQVLSGKQMSGKKFCRQHAIGEYIVDFICVNENLIIELDGGQHASHIGYDEIRTAFLNSCGYRVLRFWNNEVLENIEGVVEHIQHVICHPPVAGYAGSAPRQRGEGFSQGLSASEEISELVSAGGDTIAIRCPAHPVAHQLLAGWGGGLAAPSANRSGRVSPTTAQHVRDEFGDTIFTIDGGACQHGIESTVVDVTGPRPVILRPGSITRSMIEYVLGPVGEAGSAIKSPGQLESHYAPSIPVRLNATSVAADEALLAFGPPLKGAARTLNLSERGDLLEAASNLFAQLRALDDAQWNAIAVMPVPHEGIGEAINDRLKRAAA